jgi:hypothetical protein
LCLFLVDTFDHSPQRGATVASQTGVTDAVVDHSVFRA